MRNITSQIGIIAILVFGAVIRLYHIHIRDFWYDEAFTGIAVRESWSNMMRIVIADTHPPLYYLLLKPFAALFGYSPFGIRFFSSLWGIIAIYIAYRFTKTLKNKTAALFAAYFTAISPFAIMYSQEGRMYTMLAALVLLAAYCLLLALRTQTVGRHILWGICMAGAALTHYMGIVASACLILIYVYFSVIRGSNQKHMFGVAAVCVAIFLFLPWAPHFAEQFRTHEEKIGWIRPATVADTVRVFQIFLFGTPPGELSMGMPQPNQLAQIPDSLVFWLTALLVTGLTAYLIYKEKRHSVIVLVPSVLFVLIIYGLTFFDFQYVVARYLISASYFFFIAISIALCHMPRKLAYLSMGVYAALLLCIIPFHNSQGYTQLHAATHMWHNRHIYTLDTFEYVTAKYYFGYDRVVLFNKDFPEYDPSDWLGVNGSLRRALTVDAIRSDKNAFIIWKYDEKTADAWKKTAEEWGLKKIIVYDSVWVYMF